MTIDRSNDAARPFTAPSSRRRVAKMMVAGTALGVAGTLAGARPHRFAAAASSLAALAVAASDAPAAIKARADHVCDGTADEVEINQAIAALPTSGGTVLLSPGSFHLAAAVGLRTGITLQGGGADATALQAVTADAGLKAANTQTMNRRVVVRDLSLANDGTTPVGIDFRFFTESRIEYCSVDGFAAVGVRFGGDTTGDINAGWSNLLFGSWIVNNPTAVKLDGVTTESGVGTANWITIERCLIQPTNTASAIGIDVVVGESVRIIDNDISYAAAATGILIRRDSFHGVCAHNRFEAIGREGGSHQVELEFGPHWWQFHGNFYNDRTPVIYAQPADRIVIASGPTGGTFRLTFGGQTTAAIPHNAEAAAIQTALGALSAFGADNVIVSGEGTTADPFVVSYRNGIGKAGRSALTANASDLTGGQHPMVTVTMMTAGRALAETRNVIWDVNYTDGQFPRADARSGHLEIDQDLVLRRGPVGHLLPNSALLIGHQEGDHYPSTVLMVDGTHYFLDPTTAPFTGTNHGSGLRQDDAVHRIVRFLDNSYVRVPVTSGGLPTASATYRGALARVEGGNGVADALYICEKAADGSYAWRAI